MARGDARRAAAARPDRRLRADAAALLHGHEQHRAAHLHRGNARRQAALRAQPRVPRGNRADRAAAGLTHHAAPRDEHVARARRERVIRSRLAATPVPTSRASAADFTVPIFRGAETRARLCVSARDLVNWGGTPLPEPPPHAATVAGHAINGAIAIWYLPKAGRERSYVARLGRSSSGRRCSAPAPSARGSTS